MKRRPGRRIPLPKLSVFDAVASSLLGHAHLLIGFPQQIVEIDLRLEQNSPHANAQRPVRRARLKAHFSNSMSNAFCDFLGILWVAWRTPHLVPPIRPTRSPLRTDSRITCNGTERIISGATSDALLSLLAVDVINRALPFAART